MRDDSTDDEGIAEDEAAQQFQDAKYFVQHCRTVGDMAQDVVGECCVEGSVRVGQLLRGITVLEDHPVREICGTGEAIGVVDAGLIDIDSEHGTACSLGELQGISA